MINFDINNFRLNKNYSISASAGTGKTFNMVEIVSKLVENGIDIDNILIVTYTEKAAGELKDRISRKLNGMDMSKSHIGTIHSFCKDVINSYYVTMGLPSKLSIIDDSKMDDFFQEYIRNVLYSDENIKYDDNTVKVIKTIAQKICLKSNGDVDESIVCLDDIEMSYFFNDFYKRTAKLTNEEAYEFYKTCNNIEGEFKEYYKELSEEINYLDGCDSYNDERNKIKSEGLFKTQIKKIFNEKYFKFLKYLRECAKNNLLINTKYALEFYKLWEKQKKLNGWMTFDDMLKNVREAVLSNENLTNNLRKQYKYALIDEFQDTNQLQWDIFKKVFLESDKNNVIVVGDRKQSIYSFQGADLAVYEKAVKEIIAKNGIECALPDNYRSSKSIIQGYNALFQTNPFKSLDYSNVGVGKQKDGKRIYATYNNKEINGINIVIKENENGANVVSPNEFAKKCVELIVDYCSKDNNGHTKLRLNEKQRDVKFADFMVLARTKSELNSITYELTKAGVPFVKYKDDKLFSGFECAHWIALLNAILKKDFTNNNRNAFKQALFTKFFGVELKDINTKEFELDDGEEMTLLLKWKDLANNNKYDELIYSIIYDSKLEKVLGTITEIQSLNVFKQIGDYALTYLLEGNSLYSLKNKLIRLSKNSSDDDSMDGAIVAKGCDFDCVELMTMHASKGLDRAVVIVVGGEKQDSNNNSPKVVSSREEIVNDDGTKIIKNYLTTSKSKYNEELQKERDRLFYVAYTRAQNLMILPYFKDNKAVNVISSIKEYLDNNVDLFSTITYDEKKLIPTNELKAKVKKIINETKEIDNSNQQLLLLSKIANSMNKHLSFKHSYASMSSLSLNNIIINDNINENKEGEEINQRITFVDNNPIRANVNYDLNEPLIIPKDFYKGASVGTTLHEIFEQFEFTTINDESNNLVKIIEDRFKYNKLKLNDEFLSYVKQMVYNVLNAKFPFINGAKIDTLNYFKLESLSKENRKAEIEFNFSDKNDSSNSNYCNGFIDLLFKRGDYYSILDWKSDTINDDDLLSYNKLDDLSNRVNNHYCIQRVLYSYTLINWLYDLGIEKTKEEVFNKHFGGIYYVFIRGCSANSYNGIYAQTWPSYIELEKEYNNIMNRCLYAKVGDNNE